VSEAQPTFEATYRRAGVQRLVCVGFPLWKQGYIPRFLKAEHTSVVFPRPWSSKQRLFRDGDALVLWGTRPEPSPAVAIALRRGVPIWRMEDGFLRSVGLGSDLEQPLSLVVDTSGIYYDPSTPSDLERMLSEAHFTESDIERAIALRAAIVRHRISKYNVGTRRSVGPASAGRDVVLVIGQVEDDASIQRGTLDIRRNEQLLRAARVHRPHAHLMYKPHPDVVRGHRKDSLPLTLAARLCDEVVVDAGLADCLDVADEVHTMTSLVGFEALLRGLRVYTYGQPFYSGWGLTEDRHAHERRSRRLTLDELVAGTLIRYPRYVEADTGRYTTPEATLEQLRRPGRPAALTRLGPMGRHLRRLRNIARGALPRAR